MMDEIDRLITQFTTLDQDKLLLIDEIFSLEQSNRVAKFLLTVATNPAERLDVRYAALRNLQFCFPSDTTVVNGVITSILPIVQDTMEDPDIRCIGIEVLMYNPKPPDLGERLALIASDASDNYGVREAALHALSGLPRTPEVISRLRNIPSSDPLAGSVSHYLARAD